ncbi:MAG: domain S-box protein, partial [Flaviaesturariibacter sp.]|nr:domain S-box protein [Flaviaesturariibacter sp.]
MATNQTIQKTREELEEEIAELQHQLSEARDTIEAIRTGQVDALILQGQDGHQLYTLKSADHTYRAFIEKMTEGALTLSPQGHILYCNSQFASMVNLPLSAVIGTPFEGFVASENIDAYRRLFDSCWTSDCKGEVWLLAGEHRTPVQLSLTTLEMEEGLSLSMILTDLTSQKAAQQQLSTSNEQLAGFNKALEASNHDLQQFASVASHDLQEPLRKIHIFSNLIRDRQEGLSEDSQIYLQKVIDASRRMKSLIVDILNYSRLSAGDHNLEWVNMNEMVQELIEDFELVIEETGAEIHSASLPELEVNRGQVRQVFQNILSNALKFRRPGVAPRIDITCRRLREKSFDSPEENDGPYVLIAIEDNGIGFDEKYL